MRRIAAHYLIDRGTVRPRPIVEADDEGRIVSVGEWERLDGDAATEFYAGALCAGFVNAHCHSELSYLHGAIPRGSGFAGFARAIGQVRGGFTADERRRALQAADARMWHEGVQAVGDVVNDDSSFGVKSRSRIAYRNFAEVFGLNADTSAARGLLRHPATSLTPHSTYSLQDGVFREIAAEGSAPLSVHFMESPDEAALYRGEGSLAEWYGRMGWKCDFLGYGSPAARIAASVPPERHVILVHGCCASEEEMQILGDHFTAPVAWALCPRSNLYISGLRPPVELLRRRGERICIGTDSLASNDSLSILEELKALPEVPLPEVLEWATLNGAQALGMEAEAGSVEAGKRCGLVLIENIASRGGEPRLTAESRSRRLL